VSKTKISEFSSDPANNTDIDGINIAEGCAPSGINNAIRELMAQLKDWQSGTSLDTFNTNYMIATAVDINGGAIDGATIGAASAAAGTFTTATATTVNSTTVDTTNLEVTNIKAKDGTAAGSIADATGVVTLASSVLTTTDINGGTIDNTTIGGSTPAVGSFTQVNADNLRLDGNALTSTDTNGNIDLTPNGTGEVNITKVDIDSGAIDGTTIGASSASTGAFTTLSASSTVTLSGGTANGVAYLNGSKVVTTGSALQFDGTLFSSTVADNTIGVKFKAATSNIRFVPQDSGVAKIATLNAAESAWYPMALQGSNLQFVIDTSEQMRLTSTGLGIGTSSPAGIFNIKTSNGQFLVQNGTSSNQMRISAFNNAGNANAALIFEGYSSEYARFDSSGNLGLGVTPSGTRKLQIESTGIQLGLTYPSIATWEYRVDSSGNLNFDKDTAGKMTLDASGNLGIGTTSPSSKLDVKVATDAKLLVQEGNTAGNVKIQAVNNAVSLNTNLEIAALSTQFFNGGSERMRIDSSGNLLIGYTSSNGAYLLQVNSQIFATNATIATSDGRYKENIQSLDGALNLVSQLNPVQFSWKEHPVHNFDLSGPTIGFIAQEVEQVLADKPYLNSIIKRNECVIEPEEKDAEGNVTKEAVTEEFLGIAEGNMIALLTKAIQEQQAIIESLKSRLDAAGL
jgi:hypothetical protein